MTIQDNKKPRVSLIGVKANEFALAQAVASAMHSNGLGSKIPDMEREVVLAGSYEKALKAARRYVAIS